MKKLSPNLGQCCNRTALEEMIKVRWKGFNSSDTNPRNDKSVIYFIWHRYGIFPTCTYVCVLKKGNVASCFNHKQLHVSHIHAILCNVC